MDQHRGLTRYQRQRLKLAFDECAKVAYSRPAERWDEEKTSSVITSMDQVCRRARPSANVLMDEELRVDLAYLIGRLTTIMSGVSAFSQVQGYQESHENYRPVYTWTVGGEHYRMDWARFANTEGYSTNVLVFSLAPPPQPQPQQGPAQRQGMTSGCSPLDVLQSLHDRLTALELRALPSADPVNPQRLSSSPSACPPASRRSAGRPPRPPWSTCSGTRRT